MFGSAAKTPFGTGATFGTGTTAFGTQSTASPFGQTAVSTGMFGNKTQTSGFGTFGTTQTPSQGVFGTTNTSTGTAGLFGAKSTGTMFGQPATTTQSGLGGFGSANTGSLFGTSAIPTTSGTGLFGQTSTFGSGTSTGFGTSGSLFGAPTTSATTGGLFGSSGTQSSLFSGSTTGFTGFGTSTATTQAGTPVKFAVVTGTDQMAKNGINTTVNTRHQCITVMKDYELKSFEELRFEDYSLGRKGGATGATAATGSLFSGIPTTTSSGGLFGGSTPSTGFTGTSAFGQKTGFGTGTSFGTGTTLFGQQAAQTGGLFGTSKPAGLFGASTATTDTSGFGTFGSTPATGLFGQTTSAGQPGGLFGSTTMTQAGGLFGGGTTAFGQTTGTTGTGLFGQTGFGQTQQTGLFNNKLGTGATLSGFGTPSTSGIFGAQNPLTKPTTGLSFGGTGGLSTGAFGAGTGLQGTLFGKTAFGTPGTIASGFGTNTGTSLFGTSTGLGVGTTGLGASLGTGFGSVLGGQQATALNLTGANTLLSSQTNALLAAQQQGQLQQQIMALNNSPFGDSKLFRNSLTEKAKSDKGANTTTTASQKLLGSPSHYKVSARLTAKMKPRPINNHTMNKSKLFEGLDDESGLSPDTFVPRKSIKKLVIRNRDTSDQDSSVMDNLRLNPLEEDDGDLVAPVSPYPSSPRRGGSSGGAPQTPPVGTSELNDSNASDRENTTPIGVRFSRSAAQTALNDTLDDLNGPPNPRKSAVNDERRSEQQDEEDVVDGERRVEPCEITLVRPEYFTFPPIDELNDMVDSNGDVWVDGFIVGREGYGKVKFLGRTNVVGLNLDEIVFFRRREIEVYPDGYPNKPPVGEELNKKAEITLVKVWPNDKTTHKPIKTPERLKLQGWFDRVEAATAKLGAIFLDYQPETGTWVFTVDHFTRYGIHEFLDDENALKKFKRPPVKMDMKDAEDVTEEEKLEMLKRLKEQQQKQEAYEQEKERAAVEREGESMQDQDSDMDDIQQQTFPDELYDEEDISESPASHQLATALGMSAHRMQVMKASFFGESEPTLPALKHKERLQADKSVLSGSFDESRPRASYHPGLYERGPIMSPKVARHPEVARHTEVAAAPGWPSPALFGSPKIGTLPPKYPLVHDLTSVAQPSPMMLPTAIGSAYDTGTKLIGARAHQRTLVPKIDSLVDGKENLIADFGLVMGRSFRVGWGPGFVLVHSGRPLGQQRNKPSAMVQSSVTGDALFPKSRMLSEVKEGSPPFGIVIERLHVAPHFKRDNDTVLDQHEAALNVELEHCTASSARDGCPFFEPSPGTKALHHHATVARKNKETLGPLHKTAQQYSLVWDLGVALWGQLKDDDEDRGTDIRTEDRDSYDNSVARREALSNWLADAAQEKVKQEVDRANFEEGDYLRAIWSHLSGRQISAACQVAQQHDDFRLSLLLSQVNGNAMVRHLLQKQLDDWEQIKADQHITDQRIKVFALLAGVMVWRTSRETLNACEHLDWKRVLAVHMWYHNSPTSSIGDILSVYEDAFKGRTSYGKYGSAPFPPYREDDDEIEAASDDGDDADDDDESGAVRDTCYHLLKLYCKRSHRLERSLAPATYTSQQLDYRLSWHLYQALQSLGYSHLSHYHAGVLHSSFASQLESLGMWEWAAFVLLHINDSARREHSVRSLLCRHCHPSTTEEYLKKEHFLREKLLIPPEWIHEAKAVRSRYDDVPKDEALHLLKAGHWNLGHKVVLTKLASDAVINEEFDTLKALLGELEPRDRCSTVKDWATGGQVLLDFLNVGEKFQELTRGSREPTKYDFEEIHMQVSSLCTRINNLPCATAKDRLCQYELAKQCANYLKVATSELGDRCLDEDTPLPSHVIVPHISKLPLPEDCALAELRDLTASYVAEITSIQ